MTDKKEKILIAALELFANEGYNATSTSKIGKKAGVSEGLIFRHFESKKGLLNAIMQDAEQRMAQLLGPILMQINPKQVLKKTIELPFITQEEEHAFWKLQFKLKWETEYNNPQKAQPLIDKLAWAFGELQYEHPEHEAQLLNLILDATSTEILKGNLTNQEAFKAFLLNKYKI